jgi:hypothetical protein
MKRDISCTQCATKLYQSLTSSKLTIKTLVNLPSDEHIAFFPGKAQRPFWCDTCGVNIKQNSDCWAVSTWSDHRPNPYYQWEHEFLT